MSAAVQILHVGPASDGTGAGPTSSVGMVQNDNYFLEKIAERWAFDRGLPTGFSYRLDQLPHGFSGFERQRENKKHIDRYLYGHPKGQFRSLNELYPHFKHLQDTSSTANCPCKLCAGPVKRVSDVGSTSGGSNPASSRPTAVPSNSRTKARPKGSLLPRFSDPSTTVKHRQIDELGTPDMYRNLLDRLKATGSDGSMNEAMVDSMSPDWRAGNAMLMHVLDEWQSLPDYVPRGGELVLFCRELASNESLGWDSTTKTLRRIANGEWLERAKWEVGVVTQMPVESITEADILGVPGAKSQNVSYSGFRIEPLPEPSNAGRASVQQHKYVPLHAIRPWCYWKQCVDPQDPQSWHPTVRYALTVAASFCIVGKYLFRGTWPHATIFSRGIYLGAELVMVGDTIRLNPRVASQPQHAVTDVMQITSIRLRFVNLEDANDDDYDDQRPYNTCIHISGRVYTVDPKRSFDGIGKSPVRPESDPLFPKHLQRYGQWFHVFDPTNPKTRLEVPYTRVIGRCFDHAAVKAWFSTPAGMQPSTASFVAVNRAQSGDSGKVEELSQGLAGTVEARRYSVEHDVRIDKAAGKSWFWADSRIEQLDLHEVNGRFVGVRDEGRTKTQMNALRQALRLLDGKKGSLEAYLAERQRLIDVREKKEDAAPAASSWGMVAGSAPDVIADSGSGDAMDVDDVEIRETPAQVPSISTRGMIVSGTDPDPSDDEMYE